MKLQKIFFLLILIVLGAYTIFWYKKSSDLENHFKTQIDQLAHNDKNSYLLQYDSIERGGFPFNFTLALVNPTITEIQSPEKANTKGAEIKINGKIIDHFTLSEELKSVEYQGKANIYIPSQNEEQSSNFLVEGNMLLENESGSLIPVTALKNLVTLDQIIGNLWEHLNLDDSQMKISNLKISDIQRNSPVVNIDSFDIYFTRQLKDEANRKIHLKSNVKGWDIYQLNSYIHSKVKPSSLLDKLYQEFLLALNSKEGKIGLDFDLDLDIPNDEELYKISQRHISAYLTHPFPEFSIAFDGSFNAAALENSKVKGRLAIKQEEHKEESISLNVDGSNSYTTAYVEALHYALEKVSEEAALLEPTNENEKIIKELLVNHRAELIGLIPQINEFGTIQEILDLNIKLKKSELYTNIQLANFAFLSKLYGVQLHGETEGRIGSAAGSITLDLLQYEPLIHDLTAYINKVIRVLNLIDYNLNEISAALEKQILSYIQEISNEPQTNTKDIHITAGYLKDGVKVGTLSLDEFMQKSSAMWNEIEKEVMPEGL